MGVMREGFGRRKPAMGQIAKKRHEALRRPFRGKSAHQDAPKKLLHSVIVDDEADLAALRRRCSQLPIAFSWIDHVTSHHL
ncbi:MAG: hypothetical protein EXR86_13930 [Gammaproteobacteria bacterium]|nr:hypothetical protein [Gammaproteobacteria bacterium]